MCFCVYMCMPMSCSHNFEHYFFDHSCYWGRFYITKVLDIVVITHFHKYKCKCKLNYFAPSFTLYTNFFSFSFSLIYNFLGEIFCLYLVVGWYKNNPSPFLCLLPTTDLLSTIGYLVVVVVLSTITYVIGSGNSLSRLWSEKVTCSGQLRV